ncbi:hypothetical protein AKJ09_01199 [Labilithrix luteola]|uniref:Haloacid dehalogenase-like hydrolase n=2 Tax=Labilithrix luteola TaxID=1391654 RepID=A0A0K1PLY5_9BACT|nr:hypothetical protein AKJ09_01199 [Labilithrix luteola]
MAWSRRAVLVAAAASCLGLASASCGGSHGGTYTTVTAGATPGTNGAIDPLPSWNTGPTKKRILDFVTAATNEGSASFVKLEDRMATFDNDGTLWPEKPVVEGVFVLDRAAAMVQRDPSLREKQPFSSMLPADRPNIERDGKAAFLELFVATHTGMTDEAFAEEARSFLKTARHPRFGVPYTDLAYQPMVELLRYLRQNGFTTYVCSGGDTDFMRQFTPQMYGIPPQQVIGSTVQKSFVMENGRSGLFRKSALASLNDKDQKPVNIDRQIGKRPLVAAGNVRSAGDVAMLEYSGSRPPPSLGIVITHDDAEREFAYEEPDNATRTAAREHGFLLVSMKKDWARVFGPSVTR